MGRLLAVLSRWMLALLAVAVLAPGGARAALPSGSKTVDPSPVVVAVADFTGDDAKIRDAITQVFTVDLAKSKRLALVERSRLEKVIAEQRLGESGLVDPDKAAEVGKLVGAGKVIIGGFTRIGSRVSLNARLVDVETGRIVDGGAEQVEGRIEGEGEDIFALVHQLATRFHRAITGEWLPNVLLNDRGGMALGPGFDPFSILDKGDSGIRLEVKLDRKEGSTYRRGEAMRVSFRVDVPSHVYLFNVDATRQVTQLYPNQWHPDAKVPSGRWHQVPGPGEEWELSIEGEVGEEEIIAIASSRPLDFGGGNTINTVSKSAAEFAGKTVVPKLRETPAAWAGKRLKFYTTKR